MKSFGTVNSIDLEHGRGSIKPETGGENLPFEKSAFKWDIKAAVETQGSPRPVDLTVPPPFPLWVKGRRAADIPKARFGVSRIFQGSHP